MLATGIQSAQGVPPPTAQAGAVAASPAVRVEPLERSGASRQDAQRERDAFQRTAGARAPASEKLASVRRDPASEAPRAGVAAPESAPDEAVAALTRAVARGVRATMAYLRRVIDPDVMDGVSEMERQAVAKLSLERVRELSRGGSVDPHPQVTDATPIEAPGVVPVRRGIVIDVRA